MVPFFAAVASVAACLVAVSYFAFLRPAVSRMADAAIERKTFSPSHTITRYDASSAARRQYWNQQSFTIPDSWVFDLRIEGVMAPAKFSLEKSAGEAFHVGQRVRVKYQERGIPPFWKRVYVLEMKPAD